MGLLERLRSAGGRLGLLVVTESESAEDVGPVKIETRTIRVTELVAEIRDEAVRSLADAPAEMGVPFDDVCAAAGVAPQEHGWTVGRLQELLESGVFAGKDRGTISRAVLNQLRADGCPVEDVVRDAIARDRAVDAYAEHVARKLEERAAARARASDEIEARIRELRDAQRALVDETAEDRDRLRAWRSRKRAFESRMAAALSYLLSDPVVTIDGDED